MSGPVWLLRLNESEQIGVDLVLMRGREAVRRARIVDFLRTLDEPGRFLRRVLDRDDLVVLPVHNQGRNVELQIGRAHAELQSLMRISYAVFCLTKNTTNH